MSGRNARRRTDETNNTMANKQLHEQSEMDTTNQTTNTLARRQNQPHKKYPKVQKKRNSNPQPQEWNSDSQWDANAAYSDVEKVSPFVALHYF